MANAPIALVIKGKFSCGSLPTISSFSNSGLSFSNSDYTSKQVNDRPIGTFQCYYLPVSLCSLILKKKCCLSFFLNPPQHSSSKYLRSTRWSIASWKPQSYTHVIENCPTKIDFLVIWQRWSIMQKEVQRLKANLSCAASGIWKLKQGFHGVEAMKSSLTLALHTWGPPR